MATADHLDPLPGENLPPPLPNSAASPPTPEPSPDREASAPQAGALHRVHEVRLQQGVSRRSVSRQTGMDAKTIRLQEDATTDLRLSDLRRWQKVLAVPLSELLEESEDCLSRPILERSRMVRVMKTAAAILERAPDAATTSLAQTLVNQLVELMPELAEVGPWHQYGQRRSLEDYGRIVDHSIPDDVLGPRRNED